MATTANYPKVAFVVPWYGRDIPGGAERQTRDTAHHLAQAGVDITILTTCIKDFYSDWGKNHHRAGTTTENGIPVHRFPVQKRNRAEFDRVNTKLIHGLPITPTEEATYTIEMIKSPTLLDHIHQHQNHYIFIFLPYLFSTTLFGSTIAPTRSIIIPCLHDEPYARLPSIQKPLANAHTLIFNSHPEADLANQLVPAATTQPRLVTGEGVTMDEERGNPDRFKQKYDIDNFVLYSGRREAGKNTPPPPRLLGTLPSRQRQDFASLADRDREEAHLYGVG